MVSTGHRVPWFGGPAAAGVRTARLSELDPGPLPLRTDLHVIMLMSTGQGTHTLDFVTHACRPGTLLWGRPGQVHQFGRQPGLDATLIAFHSSVVPEVVPPAGPVDVVCWQPAGEDEEAIVADVAQIAVDADRYARTPLGATLLAHQLAVLLVRITALGPLPLGGPAAAVHAQLTGLIEANPVHRRVEDYAEDLHCSVRTLTRACLAVTGRSAKQVIDERIALEAQRLLATTDLPVADVGGMLGFDEPTNFGRFFARETGHTPGGFRSASRLVPARGLPAQRSSLPGFLKEGP
jgi:AraC-like DNA-binding protein